jgi:hypothetical protein
MGDSLCEHDANNDLDNLQHAVEFLKLMERWLALRRDWNGQRLHSLAQHEPAVDNPTWEGIRGPVAAEARDILAGLERHGRPTAIFVARQGEDSGTVLWWVQSQGDWWMDKEIQAYFNPVREIVNNALLLAEASVSPTAGSRENTSTGAGSAPPPVPANMFVRLPGKRYQIRFGGKQETIPMLTGLQVVEYLLKQPGKAARVMEINRALYEGDPRAAAIEDAFARSGEQKAMDGFTADASRTPDTCSAEKLNEAKETLTSLEKQAVQARERGEHDKADQLDASLNQGRQWIKEQETLRSRRHRGLPALDSQVENVRIKLTNNFSNACKALRKRYGLSELADHLEEQIDSGTEFKYRPVPGVEWAFDPTSR